MNVDRRAPAVAILCSEPLLAALLGAAVELCGFRPTFSRGEESDIDVLKRVRPAAVLIDCDHPAASDDALLGRALMTGARLLVFGRTMAIEAHRPVAARFRIETLTMPNDVSRLPGILATTHPLARPSDSVQH